MRSAGAAVVVSLVVLACGCTSTQTVGYGDGSVTTSPVAHRFVAPPQLTGMQGRSYRVQTVGGPDAQKVEVGAFEQNGMRATAGGADVEVRVEFGKVQHGEPGAMQLGNDKWCPAFSVQVPYGIQITRAGQTLTQGRGAADSVLTFRQMQTFPTQEAAIAAIDTIRRLAQKSIDEQARAGAVTEATKTANELAAALFTDRDVALDVPVVRSAAGVDLEPCYQLLAEGGSTEQVQRALAAYEQHGTQHRKVDGAPNRTANYGVACGIAACKLMLRDLRGAWSAAELASSFEPQGSEADDIRRVIWQQEQLTGERVIPDQDRARIEAAAGMGRALEQLFGSPAK
jgi:hypothetical protein